MELLQEYCFHQIKKRVKNKVLRVVLYVLTFAIIIAMAVTPILLGYAVIAWILEGISNLIG